MRNNAKCVLCRRCVAVCHKVQNVGVIGPIKRGFNTQIACAWGDSLADTACINCGQCIAVCPTGALTERDDTDKVYAALADPTKHVVVQPAPAVRAALGEEFGIPMGTSVTGKMACALRRLGFDKVFDTDFAADLTIMEEANELIDRVKNGGVLPMITSCSPGWIKFCEHQYPDFLPNLSSCKSPHEMEGAVIKSYYAEKAGIDPQGHRHRFGHALHGQEVRGRPSRAGPRRHGGCGHRHHHARAGADDQEVRHRLCQPARRGL